LITDKEPRPIREINPDVPEWLCAIISKLMAKQANDRFHRLRKLPSFSKIAWLMCSSLVVAIVAMLLMQTTGQTKSKR
jgi:hypothetical protein